MEREIRFSRDQDAFSVSEAATPAASIEALITNLDDARQYIGGVHTELSKDPTYRLLAGVRNEIDGSYGKVERFGEAFLDGGALELHIINEFAPYLKDGLYDGILTHINKQSITHFVHERDAHFITDEQQRRYVEAILPGRHKRASSLTEDEFSLLQTINAAQYVDYRQLDALIDGFTFVRTYALRANYKDYGLLAQQAFNQYSHPDTARAHRKLDEELWNFLESEGKL